MKRYDEQELIARYSEAFDRIHAPERVRRAVLEETQEEGQARVHRFSRRAVVLLAAALVLTLGVTAYAVGGVYHWADGVTIEESSGENGGVHLRIEAGEQDIAEPVELRNGSLFLTANGQDLDISDKLSQEEPYYYSFTVSQNGEEIFYCVAVGLNGPEITDYAYVVCRGRVNGSWMNYTTGGPGTPSIPLTSGTHSMDELISPWQQEVIQKVQDEYLAKDGN